jgi:hypothetical protein
MKRIALVVALVAIAACNKGDKSGTTDTTAAGGTIAPTTDSSSASTNTSKVKGPRTAAQATADSLHMATSGTGSTTTGASGGMAPAAATPAPDNKTGGAMGGDSAGMGGTHGDTTKKTP